MSYETRMSERASEKPDYQADLDRIFGAGADTITAQIAHDNPSLSAEEVLEEAWSLIPEATAYMMPASQEDLTTSAILLHEDYEAHRRTAV